MMMYVRPLSLANAKDFITRQHRHNKAPVGHRFSIGLYLSDGYFGLYDKDPLIGCAVVGRPVARALDVEFAAEVTRLCVYEWAPKGACSKLYRTAWRAWSELGGQVMWTYTLQSESGASLRGAGWYRDKELAGNTGKGWNNRDGRERQDVVMQPKVRWLIRNER